MELRHLRYFLAVCEEMNFTKAAEKLMIAQPPLSRQIKDLEEEIGSPLFLREHHRLSLTKEGQLLRQYASRILDLSDKSIEEINQMHLGLQGTIHIAGVEGAAPKIIAEWVSRFTSMHPDVEYVLWNGNSDDVADRIRRGLSDVGVIMEPYDPNGLHNISIYQEPWYAIFSKKHPLSLNEKDTISLFELADYELIIPSKESRYQEISDWFSPFGKAPKIKARVANLLNVYELSKANIGVAIFPSSAKEILKKGGLEVRRIAEPQVIARYSAVYSNEHILSPVAQKFVEFITMEEQKK